MKTFTKKTIAFCFPLLLALISLEALLRHIPNDYSYKKAYLDKNSKDIEILLLGSSHTYYGLDPKYISGNCFNASHVSQSINIDWEIIKKYQWPHLKYIVLPVDYFTLFHRLDKSVEEWRLKNYNIYYHIAASHKIYSYMEITNGEFKDNISRVLRYYLDGTNDINCDDLGFGVKYNLAEQDLVNSGKEAARKHTIISTQHFEQNVAILNQIFTFARQKKIKVLIYTSPAFETYRVNLDNNQLQTTYNVINQMLSAHPNVTYRNFLIDSTFKANDYYDADHLNPAGALKLSRLINNVIN